MKRIAANEQALRPALLLFFGSLCIVLVAAGIAFGPVDIEAERLWHILSGQESSGALAQIVWHVRLPRVIAALVSGMALAAAGTLLQAVMQNLLAAPSLIGVNSGAGLAAMLILALYPEQYALIVPATFVGALLALLLITTIASRSGASKTTLILSGVAVSSLLGAGIDTIRLLKPEAMLGATSFMIGGFAGIGWSSLSFALPWLLGALTLTLLTGPLLNVIGLGDEVAHTLGIRVQTVRLLLLVLAAVLSGGSVCIAGLLGFVGLIVPHAARMLFGQDQRWLLPGAMLLGGAFLNGCDLLARLIFAPYELPVGILLSLLGGPFFIYLLYKNRRFMES